MRQSPNTIKEVAPFVVESPVMIDRVVKALQTALTSIDWLTKSFARATMITRMNDQENVVKEPFCWSADMRDQFEMIANDNWNSYTFFYADGKEECIDYNDGDESFYERTLSLYLWANISAIDDTKDVTYMETLKQDLLNVIRTCVFEGEDSVEVIDIENNPLEVYNGFDIDITRTQLVYFPYCALRINMNAIYQDQTVCSIT